MSRLLKGNYDLPEGQNPAKETKAGDGSNAQTAQVEFERRAMERLGGSIAFVMKSKTFMWNGDGRDETKD